MTAFTDLLHGLLHDGSVRLREPPRLTDRERESVLALLANAFADDRLDIAGPPIAFAPETALHASLWLARACWFLLHRGEPDEVVTRSLTTLPDPHSAAEHLSADLVFRYLPQIHRRARVVNPRDPLTLRLEEMLRRFPLSGVLADLDEPPLAAVELAGHPGLLLLYAERLANRPRPAWMPGEAGQPYVELVFSEPPSDRPFCREEPLVIADIVARLRQGVIDPLKERFVERGEVVDLIALALVAGEHLFLYGPPGTAKSALIRQFAQAVEGRYFEYMLTRFSEPNELFGPVDIARLREGVVATVTTGMLPEAEFAFLDELFNANSAILNNLLTVLNERVWRRGAETHRLPLLSLFSASNHLPEEDALKALFDRFLLRCHVDNLPRSATARLLVAGWAIEQSALPPAGISADELRALACRLYDVDLAPIREQYTEVIHKVRDLGIAFSDRRAVKAQKLVAASALLCARTTARASDLWVMRYVWDRAEQIGPLRGLIQNVLEQHAAGDNDHPLAALPEKADGEEIARQLDAVAQELPDGAGKPKLSLLALARLRERVAELADRAAWVVNEKARRYLLEHSGKLLERLEGT